MPISQKKKKIIIYGGAFSPPHLGHATVAESAIRLFPCDELWLMPTANRRDKTIQAEKKHRLAMLTHMKNELFSELPLPVKISRIECDQKRLTTTYETLRQLKKHYPRYSFYLLIGSDIVGDIEKKWVCGKKLFKTAHFVISKRHPYPVPRKLPPQSTVLQKESRSLDFSSTFIRNLIKNGHSGVPYITPRVARYIKKHKLYR